MPKRVQWTTRKTLAVTVGGAICTFAATGALIFGFSFNGHVSNSIKRSTPAYQHIFVVVEENHAYNKLVGSSQAPYLNSLIATGALATNFRAAGHPSLGNYMALTGGVFTTAGDCNSCTYSNKNIFDSLGASGLTFKSYMEGLGTQAVLTPFPGGKNGYDNHHDPQAHYSDQKGATTIVDYTQLATDLQSASTTPTFSFIIPNVSHDMHSASISSGDAWAKSNFPAIFSSPAWTSQSSLLVVTTDEGGKFNNNGVMTFFVSSNSTVKIGAKDATSYTFYSLLRTFEDTLGLLPFSTNDTRATSMGGMFG